MEDHCDSENSNLLSNVTTKLGMLKTGQCKLRFGFRSLKTLKDMAIY